MLHNNCQLNILVNGRHVTEFRSPMDFQHYIEGRDGSTFEIELVNNNPYDCEFIVSVDGLSITDGKAAGEQSGGYIVPANSTTRVPGWLVDGQTAAKFTFAGEKGGSYTEQTEEGDARNKGVIATKVFARKSAYLGSRPPGARAAAFRSMGSHLADSGVKRMAATRATFGSAEDSWSFTGAVGASLSTNNMQFQNCASNIATSAAMASPGVSVETVDQSYQPAVEQTLGTGFGEATDFHTTQVKFERGDLLAMIVLYYDDRQGLKRRGIDVTRKTSAPNPFPADAPKGCAPPAGWSR